MVALPLINGSLQRRPLATALAERAALPWMSLVAL
jgi:hypothetical protein